MQKASDLKHTSSSGHSENPKPKQKRADSQLKGPVDIFNKIMEENFPKLKKEMPMNIQEAYKLLIDWAKTELPSVTEQSKHQIDYTKKEY